MQQNGMSKHGGHPLQQQHTPGDASTALSYDDVEDDGPYRPLPRPSNFAGSVGQSEAPQENGNFSASRHNEGHFHRGKGRGDRARTRGDRSRQRGYHDNHGVNGYSQPPQAQPTIGYPNTTQAVIAFPQHNHNAPPQPPYSSHSAPVWPQYAPQPYQQSFSNVPQGWQNMSRPPLPAGAFVNPAFFAQNQSNATSSAHGNQDSAPYGQR